MLDKKPEIFVFEGNAPGPSLTVLGAVHGNEKCGPKAINRIMGLIKTGSITIAKGKVTFVPICNPRAYDQNVRFTERNLNRFFYPKDNPVHYEDYLDLVLCPVVEKTDYLLDLHSYTSQGGAFIFLDNLDKRNLAFAEALAIPRMIYGWAEALKASGDVVDKKQAMGTTEYAREFGALALTLECGTHLHPRAADVGFQAILNSLKFLGLATFDDNLNITDFPDEGSYSIRMQGAYLKTRAGDFTREWKNMDKLKKGDVIARYDDGEEITVPRDGFIVLPKRDTIIGHEWFFWGIEGNLHEPA